MTPKFPNVTVKLVGQDGNVLSVMGRVSDAMRKVGVSQADIKAYEESIFKAKSYEDALCITMETVNCR